MRGAAVALLVASAPLTAGCIAAAAAIPIAAGAAVIRTETRGEGAPTQPASASVSARRFAKASDASDYKVVLTDLTELPRPVGANGTIVSSAALLTYLAKQNDTAGGRRLSALLSRPGDLSAQQAECRASDKAVFIDLDPARGSFDPLSPGEPDDGLELTLANLRSQGIAVVWFSRLGENFADAVRTALADSGLDREGRDQIVLMRDIEERKQTRRAAIADLLCPVALVGDERADFDELYLYLKNPDAAVALDAMIGRGWFLLSPFAPASDTKGASLN